MGQPPRQFELVVGRVKSSTGTTRDEHVFDGVNGTEGIQTVHGVFPCVHSEKEPVS